MDLRHLGGTWPRVLTAKEQESLIANPPAPDPVSKAVPPSKEEIEAERLAKDAEERWRKTVVAWANVQPYVLTPEGEARVRNYKAKPQEIEDARLEMETAYAATQTAKARLQKIRDARVRRMNDWRIRNGA